MRVPHFLLFTLGVVFMVAFFGCSRESSVKENVNLKNNHSRVFIFKEPIQDVQAFVDSIANTADSDTIADTLTVTVNDTVFLIGFLPYFEDQIYGYEWILTKKDGKDTIVDAKNKVPRTWVYAKPGLYEPKFVAHDGNDATDTAGTATRKAWVRVIDTKPMLVVPKDTLWTKHDGDITFPILASDSFGTITSVKVDIDASGKKEAKTWKYETREDNDSLYITIKNKDAKIDSLGNCKIYVIVTDDDNNETKDSVNLHFNRIPKLKIIYPEDGARHNINDRFYFYYEAKDDDNPQDIKYFIYAQASKNGQPPQKAFTEEDLIAAEFTSNIFEPIDANGKNVITTIKAPNKQMVGRIYWDMYATDGYDIVHMKRISTGSGTSRPWSFYIGDLSSTQGTFTGTAKYQGRSEHSGIRVAFSNGSKTFDAITDDKGNYTVKVDIGKYTVRASSDSSKEYSSVILDTLSIESGNLIRMDEIVLKDTVKPMLQVKNIDTLKVRQFTQTVYARDLGSRLDMVTAAINDTPIALSCTKSDGDAVANCPLSLDSLTDGAHVFDYTAKDKAGNITTLKQTIVIRATTINLDVNGNQNARIGEGGTLKFTAKINGAYPEAKNVKWSWNLGNGEVTKNTAVENGKATITLTYDDIKAISPDKEYIMNVSYTENNADAKAQVKFGILGENPVIIFMQPAFDDTVSINDIVHFKVKPYKGKKSSSLTIDKWDCGKNLSSGITCPDKVELTSETEQEADLAFSKVGTYKVKVKITDDQGRKDSASVNIVVVYDPPTIKVTTDSKTNEYKINTALIVNASASDRFGTIKQIKWGCSNGNVAFDYDTTFAIPAKSVTDVPLTVQLPGTEVSNHRCVFKAIDDDGDEGLDTIIFKTLKDPPTIQLSTKRDTVKINSTQTIKANAADKLGFITKYEVACSENLSELKNPSWNEMTSSQISLRMPSVATNAYYCVVQVTDDDNQTARDTAIYKVIVGLPTAVAYVNYNKVTIKDVVELNAHAQDSIGSIVKYEWGCGSATTENIGFTYSSATTPRTTMVMPHVPQNGYRCIVRVTDDDGNTAKDTVEIDIILAPPTIKVKDSVLTVREGYNITLDADASDNNGLPSDPGSIAKREWSCGTPSQIESKWETVSDFDTLWKAPAAQATFYCVARVTDNDGNTASDTMHIKFSTDIPLIEVAEDVIHINVGDEFVLDASVNDVWQGIDWFTWECKDSVTGESFEKKVTKYDYNKNGKSFMIGKDSTYSMHEKSMYCTVSAQEHSTKTVFTSTTLVSIIKQHPIGVISAADTVYLWSGDETVDNDAIYYYTQEWNGKKSIMGELGNKNMQDYWWKFGGVGDDNFYQGKKDGSIDTNVAQFNSAFMRRTYETSITIHLDYRDSTTTSPSKAFYSRHRAEEVSRRIYFRRAWKNIGKDTVIASSRENTAPVMALVEDSVPVVAYLESPNKLVVMRYNGTKWTSLGSTTFGTSIQKLNMVMHNGTPYITALDNDGSLGVFKSTNATSAIAEVDSIQGVIDAKIISKSSESYPKIALIKADKEKIYLYEYSGSAWKANKNFDKLDAGQTYREIEALYTSDGKLIVVGVNKQYAAYYGYYGSDYKRINADDKRFVCNAISSIQLLTDGSKLYAGYLDRDVNNYGPHFIELSTNTNGINWHTAKKRDETDTEVTYIQGTEIYEGLLAFHMSFVALNGNIYVALDDNGRVENSQVHVYKYKNGKWHLHGENQLPYFNMVFYDANKYFLRGWKPTLAIDGTGKVYISMLAREVGGGSGNNNGPLVMKYVADNWEVK